MLATAAIPSNPCRTAPQRRPPVVARDTAELRAGVAELIPELRARALRLSGEPATADDITQDTVERALRFAHQYQRGTNLRAWAFQILFSVFVTRWRRRRRERNALENLATDPHAWTVPTGFTPPDRGAGSLSVSTRRKLDALPEGFRTALVLVDLEERSYRDAARALGIPVGTVMSRLHRARKLLAAQMVDERDAARASGAWTPRYVGHGGESVAPSRQCEEEIAQPVEIDDQVAPDRALLDEQHGALGAAAYGPRDVQRGSLPGASRKHEGLQGCAGSVGLVDGALQTRDVRAPERCHPELSFLAGHAGQLGAEREEVLLDGSENGVDLGRETGGACRPEERVGLVDRPVRLDARAGLGHPTAAEESRRPVVAGPGVELHGAAMVARARGATQGRARPIAASLPSAGQAR
jgi:RNA polymerase sigma-70 factor (ECF subfamily)